MEGGLVIEMLWESVSVSSSVVCVGKEGGKEVLILRSTRLMMINKAGKQGCLCRILSYPSILSRNPRIFLCI
jgi:hypothetical protein